MGVKAIGGALAIGAMLLSACGEKAIFGAELPTNADECQVAFQAAEARSRQAAQSANTGTTASGIGAAIGKGIAESNIRNAYLDCLARVGGTPSSQPEPSKTLFRKPLREQKSPSCPPGFYGLYRGTTIC